MVENKLVIMDYEKMISEAYLAFWCNRIKVKIQNEIWWAAFQDRGKHLKSLPCQAGSLHWDRASVLSFILRWGTVSKLHMLTLASLWQKHALNWQFSWFTTTVSVIIRPHKRTWFVFLFWNIWSFTYLWYDLFKDHILWKSSTFDCCFHWCNYIMLKYFTA